MKQFKRVKRTKAANMGLPVREYITFELHTLICFLTVKGKKVAKIHRELVQRYGENNAYLALVMFETVLIKKKIKLKCTIPIFIKKQW